MEKGPDPATMPPSKWKTRHFCALLALLVLPAGCAHHNHPPEPDEPYLHGHAHEDFAYLSSRLLCSLTATPAVAHPGEPVQLTMTIYNRFRKPVYAVLADTPLEGGAPRTKYFDVTRNGEEVNYRGIMAGTPNQPLTALAYRRFPVRGSLSGSIDLAAYYDLSQPGEYDIGWFRILKDVQLEGTPLPVPDKDRHIPSMLCTPATVTIKPSE